MFEKGLVKSAQEYLAPGEELYSAILAQGKGSGEALFTGAIRLGREGARMRSDRETAEATATADSVGIRLDKSMAIAITSQRLLLFKVGQSGLSMKVKELLTEVPVADVEDIAVGEGKLSKPITLTVRGSTFTIETPRASNTDELVASYRRARS